MLKAEKLSFEVEEDGKKRRIIDDVTFNVNDGELLVITGPNGGGKSTLAKILMGIESASSGKIMLDDIDITDMDIDHRAKAGVAFAFQQPPRFKGMTVNQLMSLSLGEDITEKNCCKLLAAVGLCAQEYMNRQIDDTLSGGEMKRIEIATVMAKKHNISIYDEPEAGIDLWSFSMLVKQFERIHASKNESIVIISHQERIIRMADRILVIKDGKVDKLGTKEEILPTLFEDSSRCEYKTM